MVSLMFAAFKRILNFSSELEPDLDDVILSLEGEQDFVPSICARSDGVVDSEGEGCFLRSGIITDIQTEHLIIDKKYVCKKINVAVCDVKVGSSVSYLAFRRTKDEDFRISKILSIVDDKWESNDDPDSSNIDETKSDILKRVTVGKVMRREQRIVHVEPGQISFNLDDIVSEFLPLAGDWLKLETLVRVDESFVDLSGDVLQVDRIFPLRSKLSTGIITAFDSKSGFGNIDKNIAFHKTVCEPGYLPSVGDRVVSDSIESDQGIHTWRSLSVVPLIQQPSQRPSAVLPASAEVSKTEPTSSSSGEEKYGIIIENDLTFDLQLMEQRDIVVEIKNSGPHSHTLLRGCFLSKKSMSQLTLLRPNIDESRVLRPSESYSYIFRCKAKFVGTSEENFLFIFKHFKVRRTFRFNVSLNNSIDHDVKRNYNNENGNKIYRQNEFEQSNSYVTGIRPCQPPKFISVRPGIFKIPQVLWDVVLNLKNNRTPLTDCVVALEDTVACLADELSPENYREKFHTLLYLESIAESIAMQRYDISGAVMRFCGEYLALEVPGLAEKRPSLLIGDKAIISFDWETGKGDVKYEGFIHQVKNSEVLLKFNQSFHEKYNGERCDVTFKCSQTPASRCHTAINLSANRLGKEFLFPSRIIPKTQQLDLIEEGEEEERSSKDNVSKLKRRKLIWFNDKLNRYQKEAVKNVLFSKARPLPYVIFGPPGTGKTITLCETILQIFKNVPESRIMVATPSNSSANLITERILESGALKPGDLVRLVGFHCTTDGSIPERLLPYCAVGDLAREGTRSANESRRNDVKPGCSASVLGRHRITVGTCVSLGILHNMGFPRGHFSHVIVDEAGQATEPEILVPLNFVHTDYGQVILAGDPMQLGPVVQSKFADKFGLGLSFLSRLLQRFPYQRDNIGFERGYNPMLVTKLIMNYRSLPEILELPNSLFYDSELEAQITRNGKEGELLNKVAADLPERSGDPPPAIVFHGVLGENYQDQDSPSWYNPEEAAQVYFYVLKFYSNGLEPDDIGIIAPYTKQVRQIRDLLSEMNTVLPKIGSVEEFQGQERNVIILSAVRSTSDLVQDDVKRSLGFIASPNRLNVAITRARALLIILGNPHLLSQDPYWRTLITYCIEQNSYTGCEFLSTISTDESM